MNSAVRAQLIRPSVDGPRVLLATNMTTADRVLVRGRQPAPRPDPASYFDRGGNNASASIKHTIARSCCDGSQRANTATSASARAVAWARAPAAICGTAARRISPVPACATRRHCSVTLARSSRFSRAPRERRYRPAGGRPEATVSRRQLENRRTSCVNLHMFVQRGQRSSDGGGERHRRNTSSAAANARASVASTECISQRFRCLSVHL